MGFKSSIKSTFTDKKAVSFQSVGDILASIGLKGNGFSEENTDEAQRRNIFSKHHILQIAHNELDPLRQYMFQVYIQDIPGRYWVDMVNNYPSFVQRLINYGYGIVSGGITTASVMGMFNLLANAGMTGDTSPQQSLVYRTNSVKLPSRTMITNETKFLGRKQNIVMGTKYEGTLSINFTETEDLFILRQFNSWMNIEDENAVLGTIDSNDLKDLYRDAINRNEINNNIIKSLDGKKSLSKMSSFNEIAQNKLKDSVADINNLSAGVKRQNNFTPMTLKSKTDIQLLMYRYNGDDVGYKIKFYGCVPKSIGGANFTYDSGGSTISYDVEFDYDYYHIEYIDIAERLNPTNNGRTKIAMAIDNILNIGVNSVFAAIVRRGIKDDKLESIKSSTPNKHSTPLDDESKIRYTNKYNRIDNFGQTKIAEAVNAVPNIEYESGLHYNLYSKLASLGACLGLSRIKEARQLSSNVNNSNRDLDIKDKLEKARPKCYSLNSLDYGLEEKLEKARPIESILSKTKAKIISGKVNNSNSNRK